MLRLRTFAPFLLISNLHDSTICMVLHEVEFKCDVADVQPVLKKLRAKSGRAATAPVSDRKPLPSLSQR